jgi:hypothetical protein
MTFLQRVLDRLRKSAEPPTPPIEGPHDLIPGRNVEKYRGWNGCSTNAELIASGKVVETDVRCGLDGRRYEMIRVQWSATLSSWEPKCAYHWCTDYVFRRFGYEEGRPYLEPDALGAVAA